MNAGASGWWRPPKHPASSTTCGGLASRTWVRPSLILWCLLLTKREVVAFQLLCLLQAHADVITPPPFLLFPLDLILATLPSPLLHLRSDLCVVPHLVVQRLLPRVVGQHVHFRCAVGLPGRVGDSQGAHRRRYAALARERGGVNVSCSQLPPAGWQGGRCDPLPLFPPPKKKRNKTKSPPFLLQTQSRVPRSSLSTRKS